MAPTIRIDTDVLNKLKEIAIDLGLVFSTPNEVLREALGVKPELNDNTNNNVMNGANTALPTADNRLPRSNNPGIQTLLDQLLQLFERLIGRSLNFEQGKNGRWVLRPHNFVTIMVQDARKHDLAITVYGNPDRFAGIGVNLEIRADQASYSRSL